MQPLSFSFSYITHDHVLTETGHLKKKFSQENNILVKLLKRNEDPLSYFIFYNFDNSPLTPVFSRFKKCRYLTNSSEKR